MKKIPTTVYAILSFPAIHLMVYFLLVFSGWVSGDIEFAKYVYELVCPAVTLIWFMVLLIVGVIYLIEKHLK
jgi:hypothetical protein